MSNLVDQLLPKQNLFEQVCDIDQLRLGFKAVKKNRGAPGIDGVTVEAYTNDLEKELEVLSQELSSWSYKPKPVRRVEIPKPGKGAGTRLLGIPCVRDRVLQATLKNLMEPILDPKFSDSSYGFRSGRNQKQAVEAVKRYVTSGKDTVVDIDLEKFFDRIGHDRLIHRLSAWITDRRILRLIGTILRSGVMSKGLVSLNKEGSVQGGPLSPLLSNVVLDELDKELEKRGLSHCRFADDAQIFVSSQKAGERVMASLTKFIEKKLKLVVNRKKSRVAKSSEVKFLGMTIVKKTMAISKESMNRAMQKVKELTPRGTCLPIEKAVEKINQWYIGWSNYYNMTQYPMQLQKIEAHIRRRLRARFVFQQKRREHLFNKMVRQGVKRKTAIKSAYNNDGVWARSASPGMHRAFPNSYFIDRLGLKVVSGIKLPHWSAKTRVVRLG